MIQKKLPRNSKNELLLPPVSFMISGTMHNQNILKLIQNIDENQLPFEVLWMDAGWYGPDREVPEELHLSDWYRTVGD